MGKNVCDGERPGDGDDDVLDIEDDERDSDGITSGDTEDGEEGPVGIPQMRMSDN